MYKLIMKYDCFYLLEPAQKLYIRLFGRKWKWLTQQQIKYPGIQDNLSDVFMELVDKGFLIRG